MAKNQPDRFEREDAEQPEQDSMSRDPHGQRQAGQQRGMGGTGQTQGPKGQHLIGQRHTETGGSMGVAGFSEEEIEDELGAIGARPMSGRSFSQEVDPNEDAYWREEYSLRPYFRAGRSYEDYEPAYRLGYRAAEVHRGTYDDELDEDLRIQYDQRRGKSKLDWDEASSAVRDAFTRRARRGQPHRRSEA